MVKSDPSVQPGGQPDQVPAPLRVLIADDDIDSVRTLMLLLREEGHDARGVHNGQQAITLLESFDADVVILDIAMLDMSGWEVARKIRARHGHDRPMLIGISGHYKQGSDRLLSEITGFNHYLVKPYRFQSLLPLLAAVRLPRP